MEEHKHTFSTFTVGEKKCLCGVTLCFSAKPGPSSNVVCNLEDGHPGLCKNTHRPKEGVWVKESQKPLMKIVVTKGVDDYSAQLVGSHKIGYGKTPRESIGDIIWMCPELFCVEMK
ncbi:hypothetical protein KJ866_00120 [Patescibacteria group bacterium]|nr:hypothetical protein [Patescibacteria group bacterium]